MIIYRVESNIFENDKVFAGPYDVSGILNIEQWADREDMFHTDISIHPSPLDEDKIREVVSFHDNDCYCGFKSIHQLEQWFSPKELSKLLALDYNIYVYDSNEVIEGDRQLIFKPSNTKRSHFDMSQLSNNYRKKLESYEYKNLKKTHIDNFLNIFQK